MASFTTPNPSFSKLPLFEVDVENCDCYDAEEYSIATTVASTPTSSPAAMKRLANSLLTMKRERQVLQNDSRYRVNDDGTNKHNRMITVQVDQECAATCSRRYIETCTYAVIFFLLMWNQADLLHEVGTAGGAAGGGNNVLSWLRI